MNSKLKMVLMLVALAALVLAAGSAFTGCAVSNQQTHRSVSLAGPTPLVTGPAKGHWAEQDERSVITYTVLGTECNYLAAQAQSPAFEPHGTFVLGPGVTLCAIPLRDYSQTILVHMERP